MNTFDFSCCANKKPAQSPPQKPVATDKSPISYLCRVCSPLGSVCALWPQYIANTRRSLWQPVTLSLWGGQAERETREEPECQQGAD